MTECITCTSCQTPYPQEGVPYRCPACGGIYDYATWPEYEISPRDANLPGIWRYRPALGLPADAPVVSLGEGNTPLVWTEAFGRQVAFKCEYINPTGSFKDRGAATMVSFLLSRGVSEAVEDSSGNAGAAFAAYATRAGIKARVFVPDYASGPKRDQIAAYGAEVVRVQGPRSATAEKVRSLADSGCTYASHVYLPQVLPGYATIAYELVEQLGGPPGTVIAPVGQGSLLLGVGRGFVAMRKAGIISHLPRLFGVQAAACAPLVALATFGSAGLGEVVEGQTLAEGVRVLQPAHGSAVFQMVTSTKGMFIAVEEAQILPGRDQLARRGLYVEPTSALVWDALSQVAENVPEPVVAILTGFGLKYHG